MRGPEKGHAEIISPGPMSRTMLVKWLQGPVEEAISLTANFFQTFYSISKRVRCPSPAQPYVRKYCDSWD